MEDDDSEEISDDEEDDDEDEDDSDDEDEDEMQFEVETPTPKVWYSDCVETPHVPQIQLSLEFQLTLSMLHCLYSCLTAS